MQAIFLNTGKSLRGKEMNKQVLDQRVWGIGAFKMLGLKLHIPVS